MFNNFENIIYFYTFQSQYFVVLKRLIYINTHIKMSLITYKQTMKPIQYRSGIHVRLICIY